jgi:hypothetical protein
VATEIVKQKLPQCACPVEQAALGIIGVVINFLNKHENPACTECAAVTRHVACDILASRELPAAATPPPPSAAASRQ